MAEDIFRQVADVLRQRTRGRAGARARAPCTRLIEPRGLAPYATKRSRSARLVLARRRKRERDGVCRHVRVDVDAGGRALEIAQRVGGDDRASSGAAASERWTTVSSSPKSG